MKYVYIDESGSDLDKGSVTWGFAMTSDPFFLQAALRARWSDIARIVQELGAAIRLCADELGGESLVAQRLSSIAGHIAREVRRDELHTAHVVTLLDCLGMWRSDLAAERLLHEAGATLDELVKRGTNLRSVGVLWRYAETGERRAVRRHRRSGWSPSTHALCDAYDLQGGLCLDEIGGEHEQRAGRVVAAIAARLIDELIGCAELVCARTERLSITVHSDAVGELTREQVMPVVAAHGVEALVGSRTTATVCFDGPFDEGRLFQQVVNDATRHRTVSAVVGMNSRDAPMIWAADLVAYFSGPSSPDRVLVCVCCRTSHRVTARSEKSALCARLSAITASDMRRVRVDTPEQWVAMVARTDSSTGKSNLVRLLPKGSYPKAVAGVRRDLQALG